MRRTPPCGPQSHGSGWAAAALRPVHGWWVLEGGSEGVLRMARTTQLCFCADVPEGPAMHPDWPPPPLFTAGRPVAPVSAVFGGPGPSQARMSRAKYARAQIMGAASHCHGQQRSNLLLQGWLRRPPLPLSVCVWDCVAEDGDKAVTMGVGAFVLFYFLAVFAACCALANTLYLAHRTSTTNGWYIPIHL